MLVNSVRILGAETAAQARGFPFPPVNICADGDHDKNDERKRGNEQLCAGEVVIHELIFHCILLCEYSATARR
jgi:hypothetical protein